MISEVAIILESGFHSEKLGFATVCTPLGLYSILAYWQVCLETSLSQGTRVYLYPFFAALALYSAGIA